MRLNKFISSCSSLSRRGADAAIEQGRVSVNGVRARIGTTVDDNDTVVLDGHELRVQAVRTIMLHKPVGYVCSRNGQGSKTIYDLLSPDLQHLNPVGRLDKESSGLLLMTNDGALANELTHPKYAKDKVYLVTLDRTLLPEDAMRIKHGVDIGDNRPSILRLTLLPITQSLAPNTYTVHLSEGRNRQIRRTFAALNYKVVTLHRTHFGPYTLDTLPSGKARTVDNATQ